MKAKTLRTRLNIIIFGTDTRMGRLFDIAILVCIAISLVTIMAESVPMWRVAFSREFMVLESLFTTIFALEYILRIYASPKRLSYVLSFYGWIDLLAVLPAFLVVLIPGSQSLLVIRTLRLLRIFRIFKVNRYLSAGNMLMKALMASRAKIGVFLFAVLMIVTIVGTLMYLIEGEANGYTSIPKSIYWAIVTLTTVGYGDITPQTTLGQLFSSLLMIMGYAIIAVPTGIISAELTRSQPRPEAGRLCRSCRSGEHLPEAVYCYACGEVLG